MTSANDNSRRWTSVYDRERVSVARWKIYQSIKKIEAVSTGSRIFLQPFHTTNMSISMSRQQALRMFFCKRIYRRKRDHILNSIIVLNSPILNESQGRAKNILWAKYMKKKPSIVMS
jgi:hypothetical protein